MQHTFNKLKGRIVEKAGTMGNFAEKMGFSATTLVKKMAGKTEWAADEMLQASNILDFPVSDIPLFFFEYELNMFDKEQKKEA